MTSPQTPDPAVAPDQPDAVTRETFLRCTVEIWDGESEDANQFEGRVVDVVKIGDKLHLVVVADGI